MHPAILTRTRRKGPDKSAVSKRVMPEMADTGGIRFVFLRPRILGSSFEHKIVVKSLASSPSECLRRLRRQTPEVSFAFFLRMKNFGLSFKRESADGRPANLPFGGLRLIGWQISGGFPTSVLRLTELAPPAQRELVDKGMANLPFVGARLFRWRVSVGFPPFDLHVKT